MNSRAAQETIPIKQFPLTKHYRNVFFHPKLLGQLHRLEARNSGAPCCGRLKIEAD